MKIKKLFFLLIAFVVFNAAKCEETKSISYNDVPPLKTIYQDHFLVGNIVNGRYMSGDYLPILTKHYNTVTAENDMKPNSLAPVERGGQYRWDTADRIVRLMGDYDISVHGHTLVWHSQTPAWMTEGSAEQVRTTMVNYINTVLGHFKGKIHSWDVVNEAVRERVGPGENNQGWRTCLRSVDSGWFKALGADYVELAFRTARAADPDVLLYYNDYNLDNSRKASVVMDMVKEINDKYKAEGNTRNLIDGIGMQAHYGLTTSPANVRASLEKFSSIGVIVDISELDIETKNTAGQFGTRKDSVMLENEARMQAIQYAQLFNLFKEYSSVISRVTMWGMDDENNWKSIGNPCLFDADLEPKLAFFAVADPNKALNLK
jgi:endo-1,4-beta-xylanase